MSCMYLTYITSHGCAQVLDPSRILNLVPVQGGSPLKRVRTLATAGSAEHQLSAEHAVPSSHTAVRLLYELIVYYNGNVTVVFAVRSTPLEFRS